MEIMEPWLMTTMIITVTHGVVKCSSLFSVPASEIKCCRKHIFILGVVQKVCTNKCCAAWSSAADRWLELWHCQTLTAQCLCFGQSRSWSSDVSHFSSNNITDFVYSNMITWKNQILNGYRLRQITYFKYMKLSMFVNIHVIIPLDYKV
jgi:hypothetical protein